MNKIKCEFISAAEKEDLDTIKRLMTDTKLDINWCLEVVCQYSNIDMVNFVISKGPTNLSEPFNISCSCGNLEVTKLLLSRIIKNGIQYAKDMDEERESKDNQSVIDYLNHVQLED